MSLKIWLPLNGNIENQGLADVTITNNGATVDNNGKIGKCYSFNGSSNYIQLTNSIIEGKKPFTFSVWYKTTSGNSYYPIISVGTSSKGFTIHGSVNRLEGGNGTNHFDSSNHITAVSWGMWAHLAVTYDGTKIQSYLNGVPNANSLSWTYGLGTGNTTIKIGHFWGGYFKGYINDFRIYDECLSPKEVKEISKGLVLHYPLNDAACSKNLASNTDWERTSDREYMRILDSYQDAGTGEYTFSCEMKVAAGTPNVYIYSTDWGYTSKYTYSVSDIYTNGVLNGKLSQQWQKVVCKLTFTVSAEDSTIMPHISTYYTYGSGAIVSVRNPKLEKGWNPNPIYTNSLYNTVYDCSGYQNNGTITGSLSCSTDSPRYKTCVQTSSSGKIQKDAFLPSAITHYTISVWCKITDPNAAAHLWTKHSNGSKGIIQGPDGGWIYSYHGGGLVTSTSFLTTSGTITQTYPGFGQNYKDGNWHMYTIVGNGNINTCYLDGVMTGRSTLSNFVSYNISGQLNIGFTEECLVSDYRCYATALSAEDIKELYNTSAYVLDNGTLLTYNLEE